MKKYRICLTISISSIILSAFSIIVFLYKFILSICGGFVTGFLSFFTFGAVNELNSLFLTTVDGVAYGFLFGILSVLWFIVSVIFTIVFSNKLRKLKKKERNNG